MKQNGYLDDSCGQDPEKRPQRQRDEKRKHFAKSERSASRQDQREAVHG